MNFLHTCFIFRFFGSYSNNNITSIFYSCWISSCLVSIRRFGTETSLNAFGRSLSIVDQMMARFNTNIFLNFEFGDKIFSLFKFPVKGKGKMFIFTLEFISTRFMLYLNFPYVIKCIGTYKYLVEGCHRPLEDLLYRWQPFVSNELNLGILFLLFFVGVSRLNVLKINKI